MTVISEIVSRDDGHLHHTINTLPCQGSRNNILALTGSLILCALCELRGSCSLNGIEADRRRNMTFFLERLL